LTKNVKQCDYVCLPQHFSSTPLAPASSSGVCPLVFPERERTRMAVRIGELLLKEKRITPAQLQEALNYQKTNGGKLGYNLVKLNIVKDDEITSLLSKQYGVPSINLTQFEIDAGVIKLIPAETAHKYQIVPLSRSGATLTIAMIDPTNVFAMDDIKFMTGYNVEPVVASESAVADAITRYYTAAAPRVVEKKVEKKERKVATQQANLNSAATLEMVTKALEETAAVVDDDVEVLEEMEQIDVSSLEKQGGEAPVIRLVNLMLMSAIQKGASDIHIEPYEKEFRVRFRIDGILYNVMAPPMKFRDAITSRIKIMAKLDIAEKRLPQDGRIKIRFAVEGATKEIDFRVSCLPTLFGEKIVLRLLDKDKLMLDMTKLGFETESLAKLETAISKPWGMVLVTGPTGSGKTNTLYSSIAKINTMETNIMTAEDPVEFNLVGVNQVQVRENIGLNFAAALRSFLRQDPNIILVGEIRDFETAEIAVKASLTGHLVLSTLHTNDAPGTISRLMNMGIEPFLVASSVNLICAQRLVRRICTQCKEDHPTPPEAMVTAGFTPEESKTVTPKRGKGCDRCNGTGYKGRVGLYEVMEITEELRELILVGASSLELKRKAVDEGMITLRRSGLRKVIEGVTTIEEVARETVK
jgi:type IV pilus assembly protein PilB